MKTTTSNPILTDVTQIDILTTTINDFTNPDKITTLKPNVTISSSTNSYDTTTLSPATKNNFNTTNKIPIKTTTIKPSTFDSTTEESIVTSTKSSIETGDTKTTNKIYDNTRRPSTRKDLSLEENYLNESTVIDYGPTTTPISIATDIPTTLSSVDVTLPSIITETITESSTIIIEDSTKLCKSLKDCDRNEICVKNRCIKECHLNSTDTNCSKGTNSLNIIPIFINFLIYF